MTKPVRGPVALLDATEAADLLGVSLDRFRHLEAINAIGPMDTPVGPRYRHDELTELAEVIAPASWYHTKLKPCEAARILRVTTPTLRRYAKLGYLHRDAQGYYDADEVHILSRQGAVTRLPQRAAT